jgi:hypothetical protein
MKNQAPTDKAYYLFMDLCEAYGELFTGDTETPEFKELVAKDFIYARFDGQSWEISLTQNGQEWALENSLVHEDEV